MKKQTLGFTLVELVIVLGILGILAVSVLTTYRAPSLSVAAQANQLASDIRYTQSLAMTKGTRYRLVITTPNKYQILTAAGAAIMLAMGSTTMTLGSGVNFGTISGLPSNLITFDGLGNPYTDAATPGTLLAATATIVITSGTDSFTVAITPNTGRVTAS